MKRSTINNYPSTIDINWAVPGELGCAVQTTVGSGDRSNAFPAERLGGQGCGCVTSCLPQCLVCSRCSNLLSEWVNLKLAWVCFPNRNWHGVREDRRGRRDPVVTQPRVGRDTTQKYVCILCLLIPNCSELIAICWHTLRGNMKQLSTLCTFYAYVIC